MDDMRNRYHMPGQDDGQVPARPVHETLRHAYQPPPSQSRPAPVPARTHLPAPEPPAPPQEPALPTERPTVRHRPHHQTNRLWRKLIAVGIVLVLLAAAGLYAYPKYVNANPFPADIRTSAGLSLFYPGKLPAGYTVDKASMNLANGIVIYAASSGNKRLVFTLQKTPAAFDFANFYKQQLTGDQQYQTPYGQATIGKNSNHYLGSLTAGDTWLLLSSSGSQVSMDDMSLVMTHLKRY